MAADLLPGYAELHCLSNFSFLRGASHPEELCERAASLGYAALALTDECSLAGIVRAHLAAKDLGLALVVGSEFALDDGTRLVLYATDRATYGDLAQLITRGRRQATKGSYRLSRADVEALAPRCLALWVPPDPLGPEAKQRSRTSAPASLPARLADEACWIAATFGGHAWLAVELFARAGDEARRAALEAIGGAHGLPLVAAGDVHMHVRARRALQDTLTAIRLRTPVAQCGRSLFPNGERHLRSRARLATLHPPELLAETLALAARCRFSLDELRYEYPEEVVPPGETPGSHLRKLVEAGLARRYPSGSKGSGSPSRQDGDAGAASIAKANLTLCPSEVGTDGDGAAYVMEQRAAREGRDQGSGSRSDGADAPGEARAPIANPTPMLHGDATFRCATAPAEVRELIEHELALIAELGYEPYFLTVHDIVAFAREKGILCQGRGSAANSAVCYALGITEVDPARMSMLFERFISKERNEPPDIDVDFEHQRREEVMQYVYAKYGRDRAALAATLITYRPKSAVRDVGKALGLGLAEVDRLAGVFAWWDGRAIDPDRIREAGFDPKGPSIRRLIALSGALMGFPRHLSQHVGGFVIARGLLERMVPVENAAMADRTVIQWDKDDLDAMGLLKVDCLALGMLSAIRRCLDMVGSGVAPRWRMQDIPAEDPEVYAMIQRADTIGVFQIESRAQMSMLPRLRPANFYDLVIEVAIVRPGPIQGGMVHPYLKRRQGLEPVTYPSEAVKAVLERTLGVPIFQEQVMQLAIVAAGFTPGEADQLRRSMAAWRRKGGLEKFEERLVEGMRKRGYGEAFARQIYQQILGFGEYGFPESHSASFSLLVYVSSWLKRYHPAAFTGALLNSLPMGFYAPAQLVADARRHGVVVRPPDVAASGWDCHLEPPPGSDLHPTPIPGSDSHLTPQWGGGGPALRLGLRMVSGLTEAGAQRIEAARASRPFADVADLARRARLDRRDLEALADADALASLAGHRHAAVWDVAGVEKLPEVLAESRFDEAAPALTKPTEGEDVVADYRRLGLTLRRHPVALLRRELAKRRLATAADILHTPHGRLARTAGIVIGRQRPDTTSGVVFVTLEDETGATNVIVWRDLGDRQRRELLGSRLMAVYGKVEREGDVVHLIAGHLVDLTPLLGSLPTRSRDFH
ncbi:MAG TPA: error-prone DNA polymerase [Casimicrobiaceae bacterium]|nr:error-prone DNA polymerase [Casimicrobiaceae bacterium]